MYAAAFSRFLADDTRLHFAAHSHHPWPDVARDAQLQAWDDAARWIDAKWSHVFDTVVPQAQGHVARLLKLPGVSLSSVSAMLFLSLLTWHALRKRPPRRCVP